MGTGIGTRIYLLPGRDGDGDEMKV